MKSGQIKLHEETFYSAPVTHHPSSLSMPYLEAEKLTKSAIQIAEAFGYEPGVVVRIRSTGRLGVIKEFVDKPFIAIGYGADQPRVLKISLQENPNVSSYYSLDEIEDYIQGDVKQVASNDE